MMKRRKQRKSLTEARAVQTGFRLEIWLKQALEEIAREQERTVTQVIRQACKEYIERERTRKAAA